MLLPKEAPRVSRPERPRGDAGHAFLAKPQARAGLEPATSPGKGAEPRALAPAGPGPGHAAVARTPAKSLAAHRASPDPPAADLHREKTQSKPFSIQELELRALGKTTLTAATFIDAIIMRQIAHDKGPREGGSLATDSPRDGKTPGPPRPHPVSWPKDIFRFSAFYFPALPPLPPFFIDFGLWFFSTSSSSIARAESRRPPAACPPLVWGAPHPLHIVLS